MKSNFVFYWRTVPRDGEGLGRVPRSKKVENRWIKSPAYVKPLLKWASEYAVRTYEDLYSPRQAARQRGQTIYTRKRSTCNNKITKMHTNIKHSLCHSCHSGQWSNTLKTTLSDRIHYIITCFMTHDCSRKAWSKFSKHIPTSWQSWYLKKCAHFCTKRC